MTTVLPAVLMIFLIVFGFIFISITVTVDKLEADVRDKSSEIDGSLWDRAFQLTKLVEILDNKGIEHEIEAPNINAFGLGMSTVIQSTSAESLDTLDRQLKEVLKKHPELKEDEEFKEHLDKFDNARAELMKATLAYNKSANRFNSRISTFPSSAISAFHKKKSKPNFMYYFGNLNDPDAEKQA